MANEDEGLTRRRFMHVGAAGVAGAVLLGCDDASDPDAGAMDAGGAADAGAMDAGAMDAGADDAGQDAGAEDAGPPLSPLAIPTLEMGTVRADGVRVHQLEMADGSMEFLDGLTTPTAGYNGDFLGPALMLRTGEQVELNVTNRLGRVTTTHWHGMHVPAEMDGGPHQLIADGETWTASFAVLNPASMCWFHPHAMGEVTDPRSTGHQVYMGLAGLLYIYDDESDALGLPSTYGVDDVPLVLQDRRFNPDGSFHHLDDPTDHDEVRKGGEFMVNGVITPAFDAGAQLVRFRILNGSNARLYNLSVVDDTDADRDFAVVGSDGGLLTAPVSLNRLELSPGERAEIVVDLSSDEGRSLRLVSRNDELINDNYSGRFQADEWDSLANPLMTIRVGAATAGAVTTLPSTLASFERIPESEAARTREFLLGGPSMGNHLINGQRMDITRTDEMVPLGDTEIWEIANSTSMAHPFHIHGQQFQVLSRSMGGEVPTHELGWKDTVLVRRGEIVQVIKRHTDFADATGHFMYHCHILEHEDRGMMGQFVVLP